MTIDEAIKHCEEVSEENEAATKWQGITYTLKQRCAEQASDYKQLAEWLTELKRWKENPFRQIKIKCKENYDCNNCDLYEHCLRDSWNGYPMEWDLY